MAALLMFEGAREFVNSGYRKAKRVLSAREVLALGYADCEVRDMSLTIDAALGDEWEELGGLIRQSGQEDASGARRYFADLLRQRRFDLVASKLKIDLAAAIELAAKFS
jgi:hypothetical protein